MQLQNRLNSIIKKVRSYHPDPDIAQLREAYEFAAAMHEGQMRKSGEPYMSHPLEVMDIIADLRLDVASLVAGLLHDTVEDTDTTVEELSDRFGEDVAFLVDGVTKLSKFQFNTREEAQAENIRKMIIAMSRDLRVILVKLADRLHNMRTLKYMNPSSQERISRETMDIYAPLAHRLGLNWVKTELEDLSFRYLHTEAYYDIAEKVASKKRQRENFIREVITILQELLGENDISGEVYGRPKNFWSIYRKMRHNQIEFEQVFDVLAFRILVDERVQCYESLGLVHNLWKPIPGRFKDYIAIAKPNGYQSLHTSVIGPYQERIEIQIRTHDMHKVAEEGIAAHWLYKEGKAVPDKDDQKFAWLHRLMEEHQDHEDPMEFLESVKIDLFHDEVYVFTPDGDVLSFPAGATCVDFAFAIHSEVGAHCSGAKVNGMMVPLKTELHNGDIVEILTHKNQRPNKDWLNFVTTSRARTKIRNAVRREQRERSQELGRELLDKELKRYHTNIRAWERAGNLAKAAELSKFNNIDDMLADVGYGKTQPDTIVEKIYPTENKKARAADTESKIGQLWDKLVHRGKTGVVLDGIEDVMVQYAKCCNPLPGDEIIGFVTRGRGLSVHTRDCTRVTHLERERQISVRWANDTSVPDNARRPVSVRVYCTDKPELLANISQAFSASGVNISQAQCVTTEDHRAVNTFEVLVQNTEQLKRAMRSIEKIKGVYKVERTMN
ncbi:bifunctional (p)ppGpp synthetase/guanosine-3',5'-bis(diphosphate) 3'-pyrophosphohydrolase [Lujinxingia sediminis]|uniref:Bifunctional (P)ppGpp synthetase/guanosine-3',5'-bis(Diphosphate) 3'-pyrophosphohydrolase n=1 Tax=Lujinxingia sediminis TaxID=2480984 RepID=A0ABY0CXU4_9DELT|nr:bifunctional (p)ppGpp synthetase/guanosine-3',5'-bis(diphosphate) 3'-pyrophosphohydrolase [Lujinxingia sediminis]RVU48240.1 bifunctional (p)ppGpp synthetase/guanosine-3',5'-bis(diphosphate) 3'-pyrophosphohydrolase [Lujinxingia sediminis]